MIEEDERKPKKFHVEFDVEGTMVADDIEIGQEPIENVILNMLDAQCGKSYWRNRDINTKVSNLSVQEVTTHAEG